VPTPLVNAPENATEEQKESTHLQNLAIIEGVKNWSVDKIFEELYKETDHRYGQIGTEGSCRTDPNGNCEGNELEDLLAYAKRSGLRVIAYEAGHETNVQYNGAWIPLNNLTAAYNSEKMYAHTKYEMEKWYSWMGYDALLIKNGFYAQKGYGAGYAVAEKEGDASPQYRAYRDMANSPSPPLTRERGNVIGVEKVTLLPGWQIASYDFQQLKNSTVLQDGYAGSRRLDGTKEGSKDVYLIRNETSGLYGLRLKTYYVEGNSKYDIFLDGKIFKARLELPGNFTPNATWSEEIKVSIPYGTHSLHFQRSEGTNVGWANLIVMEFTLLNELPPAKPDLIYGDLVVCKGNTKAKYEVSPVDFSVCEYEWSGLPATATILPKTTSTPITGQGTYKMFIDWGSTPNGVYDLKVVGKNQSKLPGNTWLTSPERIFKVTVQTCGFEIDKSPICVNENVTYTPSPIPDAKEYRWDLGPGATPNRSVVEPTNKAVIGKYTTIGTVDVKLTVKNAAGEDKIYFNVVNVVSCNSPIVVSPVKYCKGATALALTAELSPGGSDLKWYTALAGTPVAAPTPSTQAIGTTSYWVTQMNNGGSIESTPSKIDVIITDVPTAPLVENSNLNYCQNEVINPADITSKVQKLDGYELKWYSSQTGTPSDELELPSTATLGPQTIRVSQANTSGCESGQTEITLQIGPGTTLVVTQEDPTVCGLPDGKLTIAGLENAKEYKVEYEREGESKSINSISTNGSGQLKLEGLSAGKYTTIGTVDVKLTV
ncbi:MAG TPA: hypothetical protein VF691_00805, partial [Cytophagaceae bacterium]